MANGRFCTKCGEFKQFSDFYKHKNGKFGVTEQCKDCIRNHNRQYYQENKTIAKYRVQQYREKYPEKIRQSLKKYRLKNKAALQQKETSRQHSDALFNRIKKDRTELNRILKFAKQGINRKSFLLPYINLSPVELWKYLLSTWEEKYGKAWNGEKYNIDHIIPCCAASTVEEIDNLFRYTNLRMLTPEDNIAKKKQDALYKNV